ncbi:unnamed protein product, partial [Ostreobium quekettii]
KHSDFRSKREMKNALKQLKHFQYVRSFPNNGIKTGGLSQSFVFELTNKVAFVRKTQRGGDKHRLSEDSDREA